MCSPSTSPTLTKARAATVASRPAERPGNEFMIAAGMVADRVGLPRALCLPVAAGSMVVAALVTHESRPVEVDLDSVAGLMAMVEVGRIPRGELYGIVFDFTTPGGERFRVHVEAVG